MANKNILLIEPGYKNKYPPLGLMKIAQYHGPLGKRDRVKFIKGIDRTVLDTSWDRIYVTTLFTFEWKRISDAIDFAISASGNRHSNIFVGGIAASLMIESFQSEKRWQGVRFIKGLLKEAPAKSLQLDAFEEELYSDDVEGMPIEEHIPDYSILTQVDYKYPVHDAYFAYASRGCVRKCSFCGVPKLEGDLYDTLSLSSLVNGVQKIYGPKKDLILMDNNVVASPRFKEIIAEIRDLGFGPGAKLQRGRVPVQRRVDFNQGVDARILCKNPMYLKQLATICIDPLRIAFDHLGLRKPYEAAVRYAHDAGLTSLSNYMLYNFHDSPGDLYERMSLNISLNEELGVRIFSFPMRYQPTDMKDRSHVGEHWNKYLLRSMQLILQATHGIVSGAPSFFRRAFGAHASEFEDLLMRPHKFIFNRDWFEEFDGRAELEDFQIQFKKLSAGGRAELLSALARFESNAKYNSMLAGVTNRKIANLLKHYVPLSDQEEAEIWNRQKQLMRVSKSGSPELPDDIRVEDAGLELDAVLDQN